MIAGFVEFVGFAFVAASADDAAFEFVVEPVVLARLAAPAALVQLAALAELAPPAPVLPAALRLEAGHVAYAGVADSALVNLGNNCSSL